MKQYTSDILVSDRYPPPIKARLASRVRIETGGCWTWLGVVLPNGYGRISYRNRQSYTHRVSYEAFIGRIPDGLVIDHVCKNRACCNPDHLDIVTPQVNAQRGRWYGRTHCKHGHEYTTENVYLFRGAKRCRRCNVINVANVKRRRREREAVRT